MLVGGLSEAVGRHGYCCPPVDTQRLEKRTKAERRGEHLGARVCVQLAGLGCWSGKWHWGASYAGSGGIGLCTRLGATQTLFHASPSLPCFTDLQCVLLLGLKHLLLHLTPLWSAARFPADLPLSLLPHTSSAPSATPNSARLSAAGGLPLPRTPPLAGARVFGC